MNAARRIVTSGPENSETPLEQAPSWVTPNRLFLVRNHFEPPVVTDARAWELTLEGLVTRPMRWTLAQLEAMPQHGGGERLDVVGQDIVAAVDQGARAGGANPRHGGARAQAERDRNEKLMQLQMAREKMGMEMSSGNINSADMLKLYQLQQAKVQQPSEFDRVLSQLSPEDRAKAIRVKAGLDERAGSGNKLPFKAVEVHIQTLCPCISMRLKISLIEVVVGSLELPSASGRRRREKDVSTSMRPSSSAAPILSCTDPCVCTIWMYLVFSACELLSSGISTVKAVLPQCLCHTFHACANFLIKKEEVILGFKS